MAINKKKKFSMRPEAAEEGLFGNVWAKIVGAKYGTYGEHAPEKLSAARQNGSPDDPCGVIEFLVDGSEEPVTQYFGCGSAQKVVPSEDGEEAASEGPFIIPAEGSSATGLNKSTGMYALLNTLGKPAEGKLKLNTAILDEKGLDALVGLHGYFARVPAPRISSVAVEEGARERTIIVCQEIDELPGKSAKKAGPTPVEKKGKKKDEEEEEEPEADEGGDEEEADEVTTEAQAIVVKALEKAGDSGVKRDQLLKKVFNAVAKSDNRKAIIELLKDDDFISEGPWSWDEDSETLTAIED